jgi:hypothetical protein
MVMLVMLAVIPLMGRALGGALSGEQVAVATS